MTGNATNVTRDARAPLVAAAKRHGMHTVAVMMSTPASVCVERQGPRPASRSVPQDTVRSQHQAMVRSHPMLLSEGFNDGVFASSLCRLEPFLQRLSEAREADLGDDESEGLGDLLLVRRYFGPEILPLWRWKHGSDIAGGDRVAEIRLGQQYLILALRTDADGDYGFDALLPCPVDPECAGPAWAPVYSVTDLYKALTGSLDSDPDTVCTEHGPDDPEGRADLEQQYADAVRA